MAPISQPTASNLYKAAIAYAELGVPILPIHHSSGGACSCGSTTCGSPGKHPIIKGGYKNASRDPAQIKKWWSAHPNANIGLVTGAISRLVVIDVDPRHGGTESVARLEEKCGPLPTDALQASGGGGSHYFLRHPGVPLRSTLDQGIDVKADGGYVVVAPSRHVSRHLYVWQPATGRNCLLSVPEIPPTWLDLMKKADVARKKSGATNRSEITEGNRNSTLASIAGSMRRNGMSQEAILAALLEENKKRCNPPLDDEEVRSVAESISKYEPRGARISSFRLTSDGLYFIPPGPDQDPIRLCDPLEVLGYTRDANGESWGRVLRWIDQEVRRHIWAMPMSLLAGTGNEYLTKLLDGGLRIEDGPRVRKLLTTYIQTADASKKVLCVPMPGWHEDVFVLPTECITQNGTNDVVFQSSWNFDFRLSVSGSLEDWTSKVGSLASGNSRLLLALSAAFAAPLVRLLGLESGGIHLVGDSSTGKTTALIMAGSVLGGGGPMGFSRLWRATENALEIYAGAHNDHLLVLDELSQVDPREAAEIAYLLANGSGKSRMTKTLSMQKTLHWTLLFLSSGEVTLAEHAQSAGRRTRSGVDVRVLNIPADAGSGMGLFENIHGSESPSTFAMNLKHAALNYYGSPLRPYLKFVVASVDTIKSQFPKFLTRFVTQHSPAASGQVMRALQRFALIAFAGELATAEGLTGWTPDEATNASLMCFRDWIVARGTDGSIDSDRAIRMVRRFLEQHSQTHFPLIQPQAELEGGVTLPSDTILGFRHRNRSGQLEYLIPPDTFRTDVCREFNPSDVLRALDERGFLIHDADRRDVYRHLPDSQRKRRVYCIRAEILEDAQ